MSHPGEARALSARPRKKRISALAEIPLLVVAALCITLLVKAQLGQPFSIPSASMEPQLQEGDRVLVSRTSYRLHDVHRGDVIVFPSPTAEPSDEGLAEGVLHDLLETVALRDPGDDELIKRVVGLPGETISARDGQVVVDGRYLLEPYVPDGVRTEDFGPVEVQADRVFVLGDNRGNSADSRVIGAIEVDSIVGRAVARIWPPTRTAFL